ncbi:MAG: hypothetical protein GC155_16205 [Alphaproteobacteria bacterium]|nr:hypothetical protein [Alphaproteobacteria bacterium]
MKARRERAPRQTLTLESFARLDRSAVIFLIFAVCLINWAVRVLIAPVFTIEEADQLLMSQSLQFGYEARQPPMLAWIFALAAMGPGLSTAVVFAIKYILLGAALTLYYLAARNVLVKPGVSAAAVAAWTLTFYVGWGVHEDLLGAVALMACLSATLHAFTRILAWRRNRDWTYLGISIGIGLLTHHLYVVFPIAMLLAVFLSPFFRDAVKPGPLIVALALAGAIYAPYAIWLLTHFQRVADVARDFAQSWELNGAWIDRAGQGAISLARGLFEFTLPLSLFWATLFWTMWLPVLYPIFARRSTDEEQHEEAFRKLFARAIVIAAAIYLLGVLVGVETYKGWWMLPVLYTAPLWMFAHVKRAGDFPVAIRAFGAVAIVFIFVVIAGRFVVWRMDINACDEGGCRPYSPVAAWADELERRGFSEGTIVGDEKHLTGNLRALLPHARVMDASLAPGAFPAPKSHGACLAVWRDNPVMPQRLADYLTKRLHAPPHDRGPEDAIRRTLRLSEDKAQVLYYQFVSPSPDCR